MSLSSKVFVNFEKYLVDRELSRGLFIFTINQKDDLIIVLYFNVLDLGILVRSLKREASNMRTKPPLQGRRLNTR